MVNKKVIKIGDKKMKNETDPVIQVLTPFCIQKIVSKKVTLSDVMGACANMIAKFKKDKATLEKVMKEQVLEFPKGAEDERIAEFASAGVLNYFTKKLKLDEEQGWALQDTVSRLVAEIKKVVKETEKTRDH